MHWIQSESLFISLTGPSATVVAMPLPRRHQAQTGKKACWAALRRKALSLVSQIAACLEPLLIYYLVVTN